MIEFKEVIKLYGATIAIDRINLKLPEKGIYCLLGRNGAGKTTFMKLLAGHIAATDGEITVDDKPVSPGHMPENVNFIASGADLFNIKVSSLIDMAAALQDDFDREFALKMMARFELKPRKKYRALSFGMKTMLTTIITLANKSRIILLDEPTLGFDAIMRDQFNTMLLDSYSLHPRLIIVSTHQIDEIAKVTERLIIIDRGCILLEAGIDDMDERAYTLSGEAKTVEPLLEELNCIGKKLVGNEMTAHIFDRRINAPDGVTIDRLSLQDFFINFVGGKNNE